MQCDSATILPFSSLNETVILESVDQAHSAWMRTAKDLPQRFYRKPRCISDHHQRRRGFALSMQDLVEPRPNPIVERDGDCAKQIGCFIHGRNVNPATCHFNYCLDIYMHAAYI